MEEKIYSLHINMLLKSETICFFNLRAQHYGWENTYTFTKAMGETLIQTMREDVPIVIIRPSIIESSYKEPFPGWLQGIRLKIFIVKD